MNRKSLGGAALLVFASMTVASVAAGAMLPTDMRLPYHWGLDGEPDAFTDKWLALIGPPAMVAGVSLLFYFLPALEPRRQGLERSQGLYLWGWVGLLLMGGVIELALLSAAFAWGLPVSHVIAGSVGVMFVLIGNQLGKSRSMYLIGLRTPWTLASEEVWIRTHRLAGKLMVGGGLALVMAALIAVSPTILAATAIAVIAVSAGVPVIYSYVAWRREEDQARG